MAQDTKLLHIAMFPWLAFGHMIPYLELAKLIAQNGHKISFISTPRNIDRLPKLPSELSHLIIYVKLPLPYVEKLPEQAEATTDVPYEMVKYLKIAYDGLQDPLSKFLEVSSPDWLIYDFAAYWAAPTASKLNIPTVFLSIFIAAFCCFCGPTHVLKRPEKFRTHPEDFTVAAPWVPFKTTVAFRLFEIRRIFEHSMLADEGSVPDTFRMGSAFEGCDLVAVRSTFELEPEWLELLEDIHKKPVFPIGQLPPMLPNVSEDDDNDKRDASWEEIKEWLDKQDTGSVVYVAFGSEAKPSQGEIREIAFGLELSKLPFFWVFRKQRGLADTELLELPDGFEERTKDRGVICYGWVPQLKILRHGAVGGFLTHSGWSSVVEAVECEKALILLTMLADQGINARVLEEKRMAYSIPRDEGDGSFTSESVAESLRLVMVEEEGKVYRDMVKEMREVFGDRQKQDSYVKSFLSYLQTHRRPE